MEAETDCSWEEAEKEFREEIEKMRADLKEAGRNAEVASNANARHQEENERLREGLERATKGQRKFWEENERLKLELRQAMQNIESLTVDLNASQSALPRLLEAGAAGAWEEAETKFGEEIETMRAELVDAGRNAEVASDENVRNQEENKRLREELKRAAEIASSRREIEEENKRLKLELRQAVQNSEALLAELDVSQSALPRLLEAEAAGAREEAEAEFREEIKTMRAELEEVSRNAEVALIANAEHQEEKEWLRRESERAAGGQRECREENERLKCELRQATQNSDELLSELNASQSAFPRLLEAEAAGARELAEMEFGEEVETIRAELEEAGRRAEVALNENIKYQEENKRLREELERAASGQRACQEENKQLKLELRHATQSSEKLLFEISTPKSALPRLREAQAAGACEEAETEFREIGTTRTQSKEAGKGNRMEKCTIVCM